MKEYPILFSGEMVKAILDGRKTQTRRVVCPRMTTPKIPPLEMQPWLEDGKQDTDDEGRLLWVGTHPDYPTEYGKWFSSDYGKPGDRLWVRETWFHEGAEDGGLHFRMDATPADEEWFKEKGWRWRPSIFMPRWASRLTLEVVKVGAERVQDIDWNGVYAEGVRADEAKHWHHAENSREKFAALWDSINAKRGFGWEANPWVWVIEFKRL